MYFEVPTGTDTVFLGDMLIDYDYQSSDGFTMAIGMAVDANVLIFERMREEVKHGRSTKDAAEAGFTEAWATILDSNLTTLVAAIVLFYFGSGPVRGFAVTLAIGIATSMFTSVTVTRLIIASWIAKYKPTKLPI